MADVTVALTRRRFVIGLRHTNFILLERGGRPEKKMRDIRAVVVRENKYVASGSRLLCAAVNFFVKHANNRIIECYLDINPFQ